MQKSRDDWKWWNARKRTESNAIDSMVIDDGRNAGTEDGRDVSVVAVYRINSVIPDKLLRKRV